MLVVARFDVAEADAATFTDQARRALAAFAARPGYLSARLGRAIEAPTTWVLTMEWENLGCYRRALSAYDVRMATGPMMGLARDEPSAFELV